QLAPHLQPAPSPGHLRRARCTGTGEGQRLASGWWNGVVSCNPPGVNILLFREDAWGRPLDPADERCVHVRTVLKSGPGDKLRVGLLGRGIGTAVVSADRAGQPLEIEFPEINSLVADP